MFPPLWAATLVFGLFLWTCGFVCCDEPLTVRAALVVLSAVFFHISFLLVEILKCS